MNNNLILERLKELCKNLDLNEIQYAKCGKKLVKKCKINIKDKNKGKFTASAKKAGKSVQEHATAVLHDKKATTLQKRRAQFAKNAKSWNHSK